MRNARRNEPKTLLKEAMISSKGRHGNLILCTTRILIINKGLDNFKGGRYYNLIYISRYSNIFRYESQHL